MGWVARDILDGVVFVVCHSVEDQRRVPNRDRANGAVARNAWTCVSTEQPAAAELPMRTGAGQGAGLVRSCDVYVCWPGSAVANQG